MKKNFRKRRNIKKKKSIISSRFFWLGILIILILGGFFYLICFSSFFQVKEITIAGEKNVLKLKENINLTIEEKLNKKILLFNTRSIFLVDLSGIGKDILNNFPKLDEVIIERRLPNALNVSVKERQEAVLWIQGDKRFLLDNKGTAFEEVFNIEPVILKIENLRQSPKFELGTKVIGQETLNKIIALESKLKDELKIPLAGFIIVSEARLNVKTSDGWEIYFNLQEDINWQLTKLKMDLEEEIPPDRRRDLEYIELRFGNFAPYKYKN